METTPGSQPQQANQSTTRTGYQHLGKKTFWLFLIQNIQAPIILLIVTIGLFFIQDQSFITTTPVGNLSPYALLGAWCALGLFIISCGIIFLINWLIYTNYSFMLDEDSLRIKRGVMEKEEVAIPYRQIQDVDIERDLSYQMLGMSRLVILTAGHEDEPTPEGESEGILPALDKPTAEWLQAELLKRTNVEKVTEIKQ